VEKICLRKTWSEISFVSCGTNGDIFFFLHSLNAFCSTWNMGENSADILVFLKTVSCGTIGMVSVPVDALDS
jgi:hypothetical protein